jgi:hypothetical protein
LRVSAEAVRKFVTAGTLACEYTLRRQRLFRESDVRQLAHARVDAALVTVRPPRIKPPRVDQDARQQPLFGVQLRMVKALSPGGDRLRILNRKAAGS